tara:strand:+ start:337 stop:1089 length:753 start_codon:yes stop_codon:yes gene_type:complete
MVDNSKIEAIGFIKNDRKIIASSCRFLVRRSRVATLSTALGSFEGWPYGSLVTVAFDYDLSPILLFSTLSDHTRNLGKDNRASLLFEEASRLKNPQTGPRVSILGRIEKCSDEFIAKRFLAKHPEAALYSGFGDFSFWKMTISQAHFVGGFAQAIWLQASEIKSANSTEINAEIEKNVLDHMNLDHANSINHYANKLLGRSGLGWKLTGIDPDGADLRLGGRTARIEFDKPISCQEDIRKELVRLARKYN